MAKRGKLDGVLQSILQRIRDGVYGEGQRLPSETVLCDEFAVSRPTVSKALGKLREQGLINSTQGSGHYVCQRKTGAAAEAQERILGILSPRMEANESGFLFEQIFKSIASLSQQFNFSLVWNGVVTLGPNASKQKIIDTVEKIIDRYTKSGVQGIFFIPLEFHPFADEINELILQLLSKDHIRVVLVDSDLKTYPERSAYDLVGIDNIAAGYEVTRHLLKNGARRIDFLCERDSAHTVSMRIMGYKLALLAAALPADPAWVHQGPTGDRAFIADLLDAGATDIVCANDFTAMKLLAVCNQLHRKVNVVGFDDNEYSALLGIPLTTYKQPFGDIAREAVALMLNRLRHPSVAPRHLQLRGELIIRSSGGAADRLPAP
ncbi:GntR family transcriptional regulator [Martelella alba]|uniref:GntR family transcriptional regulator n=1 Tax=Martelella alba TaxID=2590451 RepID=A0ABY2SIU1_9HYPH|nr:GntR family transcriptional regulator [Martelella alba]TKI05348.1 GntR family transcriptional regulator [Martelella alba]